MTKRRLVVGAALALACRSASHTNTAPAAPAARATMVRVVRGEIFFPAAGDSAIRAFVPDVQPVDSGGECRVMRTSGSGATITTAYFPSFDSTRTTVSVMFDSVGHLVRYSENRGAVRLRTPPSMSEAQRDSVFRASRAAVRTTTISFDYAIDQAVASNDGGGLPNRAVIGSVRSMENLEKLGPPTKRLARVRRLCGV
jgi:hypothetical protein